MNRVLGETLALSVGTAIPLELIVTGKLKQRHTYLYMNIRTLYRNYFGSYETSPHEMPVAEFVSGFISELEDLVAIVAGIIVPVIYINTGASLTRLFPKAQMWVAHTSKQKNYEKLEEHTLSAVFDTEHNVKSFDVTVKGSNHTAFMISHLPLDLLSNKQFKSLDLLESHTGAVKHRSTWINKLSKNPNYANVPFSTMAIQILGDSSNQFKPMKKIWSKTLLRISSENKWNAATTKSKMIFDINKENDRFLSSTLIEMLRIKI